MQTYIFFFFLTDTNFRWLQKAKQVSFTERLKQTTNKFKLHRPASYALFVVSYTGCHYKYLVANTKRVNFRIDLTLAYLAYIKIVRLHAFTQARLSRAAHLTLRLYCVIAPVKPALGSYAALMKIEATSARKPNMLTRDANTSER